MAHYTPKPVSVNRKASIIHPNGWPNDSKAEGYLIDE
jgi:hypothetical protein